MNIISLGAGIQSTTMILLADKGKLLKQRMVEIEEGVLVPVTGEYDTWEVDHAIFSDTGWEPQSVYDHLERLIRYVDIPVHIVSAGNIKQDLIDRYTSNSNADAVIPFYMKKNDGKIVMGHRQCTNQYKLQPVFKKTRELLGLKKFQKVNKDTVVNMLIGISTDEVTRMKPSRINYIKNNFPLIDMRWNRIDCQRFLKENGWDNTPKSACIGCPFHSNSMWQWMKDNEPEEFNEAVEFDKFLRETKKSNIGEEYLHQSGLPLGEVVFSDKDQMNLFEMECEGMCGI